MSPLFPALLLSCPLLSSSQPESCIPALLGEHAGISAPACTRATSIKLPHEALQAAYDVSIAIVHGELEPFFLVITISHCLGKQALQAVAVQAEQGCSLPLQQGLSVHQAPPWQASAASG